MKKNTRARGAELYLGRQIRHQARGQMRSQAVGWQLGPLTWAGVNPGDSRPEVLCHRCYATGHISSTSIEDVKLTHPGS